MQDGVGARGGQQAAVAGTWGSGAGPGRRRLRVGAGRCGVRCGPGRCEVRCGPGRCGAGQAAAAAAAGSRRCGEGLPARARRCTCPSGQPGSRTWRSRPERGARGRSAGTHRPGAAGPHRKAAGSGPVCFFLRPPRLLDVGSARAPGPFHAVSPAASAVASRTSGTRPAAGGSRARSRRPPPTSRDPHPRRPFPAAEIAPARGRSHSMQPRPRLAKPRDILSPPLPPPRRSTHPNCPADLESSKSLRTLSGARNVRAPPSSDYAPFRPSCQSSTSSLGQPRNSSLIG